MGRRAGSFKWTVQKSNVRSTSRRIQEKWHGAPLNPLRVAHSANLEIRYDQAGKWLLH